MEHQKRISLLRHGVRRLPSELNGYKRWTSSSIGELKYNNFSETLLDIVSTETLLVTVTELG
jgi:hypothetical protein